MCLDASRKKNGAKLLAAKMRGGGMRIKQVSEEIRKNNLFHWNQSTML